MSTIAGDHGVKDWVLQPQSEYRFEVDAKRPIGIKVLTGNAEVFGSEMAPGRLYLFAYECKAALMTWQGCTIQMSRPATEYVSDETTMASYANLHLAFEQMRIRARRDERRAIDGGPEMNEDEDDNDPPRVLIIGPENSGKTTACKILLNYAVRGMATCTPLFVNLDPSEGAVTAPGTLSACIVDSPLPTSSPANPLGISATSAPTALTSSKLIPLVHWYGHTDIRKNPRLVEHLIRVLNEECQERLELDVLGKFSPLFQVYSSSPPARTSGLFIDTPANFTSIPGEDKYSLVKTTVHAFKGEPVLIFQLFLLTTDLVNTILVLGNEKLTFEMQNLFNTDVSPHASPINVVKIPRSAGVAELDSSYRERVQAYQVKNYFYGAPIQLPLELANANSNAFGDGQGPNLAGLKLGGEAAIMDLVLSPHSSVIAFDDISIYRIGQDSFAPSSALPIGASRALSEMQPVKIDPSQPGSGIVNTMLALLSLTAPSDPTASIDEEIIDSDVIGFIVM
ncbi:related to Pre-mRNA cleavage complex II protein Clp1 [Serendipita indica DSM 11827]|uniref:Polynucleotide 5'-hydroxyl-kinase GRC3 n=1 Tax=Serendipita indica (strain DSM 11827) TaxID=1109443 RepID=G4T5T7_SERID|nr:related to Pre-mRNA cleavage complex II protein Clp1 [Serendipita indica DSM 11827]